MSDQTRSGTFSNPDDGKNQVLFRRMGENYNQSKALFNQKRSFAINKKPQYTGRDRSVSEKEAIEPIPHNQAKFVSNFFLVKEKSGGFRPVINLRNLNQFIHTEHFTMETVTNLRTMSSKDGWIVTIDISDAYLTIPLDEEFKDHHKNHEASCGQSNLLSSRLQGSSIFRRLDSCCSNKAFMSETISVFSKFSSEARLQNKLRKI